MPTYDHTFCMSHWISLPLGRRQATRLATEHAGDTTVYPANTTAHAADTTAHAANTTAHAANTTAHAVKSPYQRS